MGETRTPQRTDGNTMKKHRRKGGTKCKIEEM
jgi:hypothetical protein